MIINEIVLISGGGPELGLKNDSGIVSHQLWFLESLAHLVPEVLIKLREILPLFQAIPQQVKEQCQLGPNVVSQIDPLTFEQLPDILLWNNLDRYREVSEVA